MRVGFIFPGQGSQFVGMGKDLAERFPVARETFAEADETLGISLSQLCWQGPEADLQLTANTQPALLATSVAALRVLQEAGVEPVAVAGHSLRLSKTAMMKPSALFSEIPPKPLPFCRLATRPIQRTSTNLCARPFTAIYVRVPIKILSCMKLIAGLSVIT